jgi:hypothetical protein
MERSFAATHHLRLHCSLIVAYTNRKQFGKRIVFVRAEKAARLGKAAARGGGGGCVYARANAASICPNSPFTFASFIHRSLREVENV